MDYSTWLSSSSLDVSNNGGNTLRLLDDSPVRDITVNKVQVQSTSNDVPSNNLWLKDDQAGALMEELNRVNAENKQLTEMLAVVSENYNDLKRQLMDYMSKSSSNEVSNATKRRKVENSTNDVINNNNNAIIGRNNNGDQSSSSDEEDSFEKPKEEMVKAKVTRLAVRTEASDSTLILKDGYQWRKYGQKVTRDNPCPRAYFKCSFSPSCPVKKKVQRSLEDQSMLVATYEGEHNHAPPTQQEATSGSNNCITLGSVPCNTTTLGSSGSGPTSDLAKPKMTNVVTNDTTKKTSSNVMSTSTSTSIQMMKFNMPEFQKLLVEQMATSLTKDPNFTAALAAAISGRFVQQSSSD